MVLHCEGCSCAEDLWSGNLLHFVSISFQNQLSRLHKTVCKTMSSAKWILHSSLARVWDVGVSTETFFGFGTIDGPAHFAGPNLKDRSWSGSLGFMTRTCFHHVSLFSSFKNKPRVGHYTVLLTFGNSHDWRINSTCSWPITNSFRG